MSAFFHGIILPNHLYFIKASGRDFIDGRSYVTLKKTFA